ncbi:MAG: AMP-binding protein [Nitrospirae bacterium]|nr:AMP-binding protein [Nitrospirota bacterium]
MNGVESIFTLFARAADEFKDKTAFICYKDGQWQSMSYCEFYGKTVSLARYIRQRGIVAGRSVAICAESMPQWCASYLAIMALRSVAVPIDSELGPEEIGRILNSSGAYMVFASPGTMEKVRQAVLWIASGSESGTISRSAPGIQVISFASGEFTDIWENPRQITEPPNQSPGHVSEQTISRPTPKCPSGKWPAGRWNELPLLPADETASIIFTSGTTGRPKGVILTHFNVISDARAITATGLISRSDRVMCVLPLHHTYPFMCTFCVPITAGGTIVYPIGLKGQDLSRSIKETGTTILVAVPRLIEMLMRGIDNKAGALPLPGRILAAVLTAVSGKIRHSTGLNAGKRVFRTIHDAFGDRLRFIASGGARLLPEYMERLEAYGFTIVEGYGLTETSPVVTFNPLDKRKPGSVGKPLNGAEIRIAPPESGNPAGEILVSGPMVFKGYYGSPGETALIVGEGGWLHTGDLGYLDDDGYLYVTGRLKDIIVLSSGKNVYPEDVELKYSSIPIIKEICVFSKDSGTLQATIVADLDMARALKVANLRDYVKWQINAVSQNLPPYMRLSGFTLSSEPLPKTRLGKLKRFLIGNMAEVGKTAPSAVSEAVDPFALKVARIVEKAAELDRLPSLDDNLELDLGVDSLKRVEIMAAIEETFRVSLPEAEAVSLLSIRDIVDALKKMVKSDSTEVPLRETFTSFREILEKPPDDKDIKSVGILNTAGERALIRVLLVLAKSFFKALYGGQAKGLSNLPPPPYILCPNHTSYLDAFVVASILPYGIFKSLYFQGAEDYFKSLPSVKFAKLAHVIPTNPDTHVARALRMSAWLLRKGFSLCIFPEGGRSPDGTPQQFKKGIGILSSECGVPLVPVLIRGTFEALPRGVMVLRHSKITVTIGKPVLAGELATSELTEGTLKDNGNVSGNAGSDVSGKSSAELSTNTGGNVSTDLSQVMADSVRERIILMAADIHTGR